MSERDQSIEHSEVERPNTQYAPDIKRLDVNVAGLFAFAQQKLHDQKRAEQKEDGYAKSSRSADSVQQRMRLGVDRDVVKQVKSEHTEEGEKTQRVQFGTVEAILVRRPGVQMVGR